MGKVLIALCTVFLLAFPARGEQAVTWESLTVWNDLPPLYDPAPWPSGAHSRLCYAPDGVLASSPSGAPPGRRFLTCG